MTHSDKTTETNGQLREVFGEVLTLSTVVLFGPSIDLEWTQIPAVLMELAYNSNSKGSQFFEEGERLQIVLGGILQEAHKTGPHRNQYGLWEWSAELHSLPIQLIDRSVRGKIRMSGRGYPLPSELQEVELVPYWDGRSDFLDEFSAQEF